MRISMTCSSATKLRMTAFHAAINEIVQPGHIVLDLGTGTGILAFF